MITIKDIKDIKHHLNKIGYLRITILKVDMFGFNSHLIFEAFFDQNYEVENFFDMMDILDHK